MPSAGGTADKVGNHYEELWVIDQLLEIVQGRGTSLTWESLDPDESAGVEFHVEDGDLTHYWTIKRSKANSQGWTLAALKGAGVLSALLDKIQTIKNSRAVFASSLGARDLIECIAHAKAGNLEERLARTTTVTRQYEEHVLPLCGNSHTRAVELLQRLDCRTIDPGELQRRALVAISNVFEHAAGNALDADSVHALIGKLAREYINRSLGRATILAYLESHQIVPRRWPATGTLLTTVAECSDRFVASVRDLQIRSGYIPLKGSERIASDLQSNKRVLVRAAAGHGKSTTLAQLVDALRKDGVPVFAFRMDEIAESMSAPKQLGACFGLPQSPAHVLGQIAPRSRSVLVVDQVDTVSQLTGRGQHRLALLQRVLEEATTYPEMEIALGCRPFDQMSDERIAHMVSDYVAHNLAPITDAQIDDVLSAAKVPIATIGKDLRAVLSVPLHLSIFLRLAKSERQDTLTHLQLFDDFWTSREDAINERHKSPVEFAKAIGKLCERMSESPEAFVAQESLDEFGATARAMVSEQVLVLANGKYGFFHETFFDYAVGRLFASETIGLTTILLRKKHQLHAGANARQVLSYLREKDRPRFIVELATVLRSGDVRFLVKKVVLRWLSQLDNGGSDESRLLQDIRAEDSALARHIDDVYWGQPCWYDHLYDSGELERRVVDGKPSATERMLDMLTYTNRPRDRPDSVASLLSACPANLRGGIAARLLRGQVCFSRSMFNLFLQYLVDGAFDDRDDGGLNALRTTAENQPEWAIEAIVAWFDRLPARAAARAAATAREPCVKEVIDLNNLSDDILSTLVKKAPSAFAQHLFPKVVALVRLHAPALPGETALGNLRQDSIWAFRSNGHRGLSSTSDTLLEQLALSLEALAVRDPATLDNLFASLLRADMDTVVFLLLRAWSANAPRYSKTLARYLIEDERRLFVGYFSVSAQGDAHIVSQRAIASSSQCGRELSEALAGAIIDTVPSRELTPGLLDALREHDLEKATRAKLAHLMRNTQTSAWASPARFRMLGSPVPMAELVEMTSEKILAVLSKYEGVDWKSSTDLAGGEQQVADELSKVTAIVPDKFVGVAMKMPVGSSLNYFRGVLHGIHAIPRADLAALNVPQVAAFLRRVHQLPKRPLGRELVDVIAQHAVESWPDDVLRIVSWYALNDLDPLSATSDSVPDDGLEISGLNSCRGAAANAIASLIFADRQRVSVFERDIVKLLEDPSHAVRACAVRAVIPILDVDVARAIQLLRVALVEAVDLFDTRPVAEFMRHAAARDYRGIRDLLLRMLDSDRDDVIEVAATRICVRALENSEAETDAARVRSGTIHQQRAAAGVYAANLTTEEVGARCLKLLVPFFRSEHASVRDEARAAVRSWSRLSTEARAAIFDGVLASQPTLSEMENLMFAIDRTPAGIAPEKLVELANLWLERLEQQETRAGAPGVWLLPTLVLRSYNQTNDLATQGALLTIVDCIEMAGYEVPLTKS